MAGRAIPIIAFPWVRTIIYIYIYMFVSLARVCVVKKVTSFRGAWSINVNNYSRKYTCTNITCTNIT